MTLLKPSEPWAMTAEGAAQRRGYAARSELALRFALEAFCRERWPQARVVHEIVMGEGRVRADVAALGTAHIAAFEVKGEYDDTTRLLHQVGMYQLCVPEVWMVVPDKHGADARLIRHLLPSVGLLIGTGLGHRNFGQDDLPVTLAVEAEAAPRPAVPEMALRLLWADEVRAALTAIGYPVSAKATRTTCLKLLTERVDQNNLMSVVCAQLRGRDALWRADPPVSA